MNPYAVVFDLDGVVLDAKELHRKLFLEALADSGLIVDEEFHETNLEALSSKQKISKLIQMKLLSAEAGPVVDKMKQKLTMEKIGEAPLTVPWMKELFSFVKSKGLGLGMCSNSVRNTVVKGLQDHDLLHYFDAIISNEDVVCQKPHPEPYVMSAARLGTVPSKLIVFEDSKVGVRAAHAAGCIVVPVFDPKYDLDISRVKRWIEYITD